MSDKKHLEKLAHKYMDELSDDIRRDGFDQYVKRDDVEAVSYGFSDMYVHMVEREGVELFAGVADLRGRYHFTVVAQGDDDMQVVTQKNEEH